LESAIPAAGMSSMTVGQGTNSLIHLLIAAKSKNTPFAVFALGFFTTKGDIL